MGATAEIDNPEQLNGHPAERRPVRDAGLGRILARLFTGRDRFLLALVFALGSVAAVFETLAVASIVPFLSFVLDPGALSSYPALLRFAQAMGVATATGTLLLLGGLTVGLVTVGNALAALYLFAQQRFVARTETRLASALFAGYVKQPYAFHTTRDTASLIKIVLNDVGLVMQQVLAPALLGASRALIAVGVIVLLFLKDATVAAIVTLGLGISYGIVYLAIKRSEEALGEIHTASTLERQRAAQEGLGGVKELKVLGREETAIARFEQAAGRAARARAHNAAVSQMPRYVLEAIAFGGILLTTIALIARGGSSAQTLVPTLALYAFAGYRLLPALQTLFGAVITVRFSLPMLRDLYADYEQVVPGLSRSPAGARQPLPYRRVLSLRGVTFTYPDASAPSLQDVDLEIRPNESVGLVGRTGAGKTTLADLILGLYVATTGEIRVDDVVLTPHNIEGWQRQVGYVPQNVFLANASITENIAFGVSATEIDHVAVRRAAQRAQVSEFVESLPAGFDTVVGERGVRLSGGQRQRIGIARALYHEPDVLVFDEATSALDGLTEDAVMDAIRELKGTRTVILIAHRMRTVQACDRIVMLDNGRVAADGAYSDLLERSAGFRRLVGGAESLPGVATRVVG